MLTEERKEGEKAGAGRIPRGCGDGRRARGRRKGRGGEGRLTGGARSSAPRGKRKEKGGAVGWRGGGLGRLGRKEPARFLFFLFFFKLHFQFIFNSNSIQTFSNFSQEFYKLFRNLTSNQKPCKPTDDAQTLVVSKFIKLSLIFLELKLNSNLISLNP
jgi:hypothetical protein